MKTGNSNVATLKQVSKKKKKKKHTGGLATHAIEVVERLKNHKTEVVNPVQQKLITVKFLY